MMVMNSVVTSLFKLGAMQRSMSRPNADQVSTMKASSWSMPDVDRRPGVAVSSTARMTSSWSMSDVDVGNHRAGVATSMSSASQQDVVTPVIRRNFSDSGSSHLIHKKKWVNKEMPTSASPEETALLGKMPSDSMDDIELKNIQLQFPSARTLSRDDSNVVEERVETARGSVVVAVQGNRKKPAIITYHDLGLNYISSFQAFFNYIEMRALLENFCVYHVNAPGQEENAAALPEDFIYPTMDELAEQINFVLSHFELRNVIGFGVGAGGNVLARFALAHPDKVNALCLINCMSTQAGWIEWGYQKMNARHLRSTGMTKGVLDYLMWHHFGRGTEERNFDLVQVYKTYFERHVNPANLALFIDSYIRRTDLNIVRELDPIRRKEAHTLKMAVMNITGALSPHVDDTVTLNGRLDPTNSTWMKIQDCGMVLEEQPGKVSEAFRLFLQGEGYTVKLSRKISTPSTLSLEVAPMTEDKMSNYRSSSHDSLNSMNKLNQAQQSCAPNWPLSAINITENPISEAVVC